MDTSIRPLLWTFLGGCKTANALGVWGSRGVPNAANYPRGSHKAKFALSTQGELFLFGTDAASDALWKYTLAAGTWVWLSHIACLVTSLEH